jgi:hypothetical protein
MIDNDDDLILSGASTKAGRLQRALLELLRQHERDGALPTNGRFLFYELEQAGVIPKVYVDAEGRKAARQPKDDIARELTMLREAGLVPWWWITDETRSVDEWQFAPSVFDYVVEAAQRARIDAWGGKPAPLIICESRATKGVLGRVASDYLAPITATNGQAGGFLVTDVVPLINDDDREVLYIGDHEVDGPADQIEANTRRYLEKHSSRIMFDETTWTRIALTQEQVDADPRLLELVIEKSDTRCKPPRKYLAVECEAVGQVVLEQILRDALDARLPEPLADVREREQEQRDELARRLGQMREE